MGEKKVRDSKSESFGREKGSRLKVGVIWERKGSRITTHAVVLPKPESMYLHSTEHIWRRIHTQTLIQIERNPFRVYIYIYIYILLLTYTYTYIHICIIYIYIYIERDMAVPV